MNLNSDNYHTPFFSVIVPIYNRIDFVNSGISMLLNQTFKDYEVILIDDGSVDGSAESCDEATKYGKLTVIHKENGGAGSARNTGLDTACGKYICFFDIDDRVPENWLESIYYHLEEDKNIELLVYGYREFNPDCGTITSFVFDDKKLISNQELKCAYTEHLSGLSFNNGFVWNKVYKRDFLVRNDIRFPDLRIQQDEVFNHCVYRQAAHVRIIPEILYDYYVYNKGTGRSAVIPDRIQIFKAVRESFLNLYNFWGFDDKRLLTYIHRRFINNILYNKNKTNLSGVCAYAEKLFSTTEVEESVTYLQSCGIPLDRLYRIAIERKSKLLFLSAEIKNRTTGYVKYVYRRFKPRSKNR